MTNGDGCYIIDPFILRSWRNWQTRKTKDLVANPMQVQFLSTAPEYAGFCKNICKSLFFRVVVCIIIKPNLG